MKRPAKGFGSGLVKHITEHPEIDSDAAKRADWIFFQLHPGIREYERKPFPGEVESLADVAGLELTGREMIKVLLYPDLTRIRLIFVPKEDRQ